MNTEPLPIHTVTARYGIDSQWVDHQGTVHMHQTPPDWRVHWVQPTGDPFFPWKVRVTYNAAPGMTNPCTWLVPDLNSKRYDLSQAVALPNYSQPTTP
jgi:hypothetical protein